VAVLFDRTVISNDRKPYDRSVLDGDTIENIRVFYCDIIADRTIFANDRVRYARAATKLRVRSYDRVVAQITGQGQLQVLAHVDVSVPEAVFINHFRNLGVRPPVQHVPGDSLVRRPVEHLAGVPVAVHHMGVERAVQYLLVDEQPLDEVVLGLEVKVVGEQRRHGRRTDDDVRVDQVTPDVHRAVEHQLQGQADLTPGPVVEQHPARVGVQHDRLVADRGGVRVAGPLVDNGHDGAPVATLPQGLEALDERQQRQLAHDVAPQQHEVVSYERTRVQVPEHVAKRPAGV